MDQPSIAQVQTFFAIYTHGSTVRAAKALGKSQSQISANLSRLETSLGMALFARANGRLHPTDRAHALAEHARHLLDIYQDFAAQANRNATGKRFTIGAPRSLSMTLLPNIARTLRKKNPTVKIVMQFNAYQKIIDQVADGTLDVGITKLPVLDERVRVHTICDSPSVVVVPKGHPLAGRKALRPSDVGNTPIIRLVSGMEYWEQIELAFRNSGTRANFAFEVAGVGPACRMVAENLGLTIVNELMVDEYLELLDLTACRFEPEIVHKFVWVASPFSSNAKQIKQFGEAIRTEIEARGSAF